MQNLAQNKKTDLKQRCFWFSVKIVSFIDDLQTRMSDQVLAKQMLRSATSIGANIIEALGSASKRDFANFFTIALKSSKETKYWLYLFRETKKGNQTLLPELIDECEQLSRMIAASILTMKDKC